MLKSPHVKKKRKSDLMIELLGVTFHRGQKVMSLKNSGSAKRKKSKKQQHQRSFKTVGWKEESRWRRDRTGDHFLFYKFIERTTER